MLNVDNRRAIIDRRALTEQIEELAEDGVNGAFRMRLLEILKTAYKHGFDDVRARALSGHGGRELAHAQCYLVDQLVRLSYDAVTRHVFRTANPTSSERIALVATGGYGRGEMAPFSDVDLLFLLPYKQTPWGEQVVEYMLYLLWDIGFKVGHATRSVDECIRAARDDHTIQTALLEARHVWGDETLFHELKARYAKEIVASGGKGFIDAKLAERDSRHVKLGDSRYVVEPNLKEGKGGLRDLHTLFWIAKFQYKIESVSELVKLGVLTAAELRTFQSAEAFLWKVRFHLHYLAGRPEERLTFDQQRELAGELGYADRAGARGVERFMKHYFLIAKDVGDLTRTILSYLQVTNRRKSRLGIRLGLHQRPESGFLAEGSWLTVAEPDQFAKTPIDMLRIFQVAQEKDYDIHPQALRLIRQNLKRIDGSLRARPDANEIFLSIMTSRHDPETHLRRLNEAGVFGRFVPNFGHIVAQMQYDMYHTYTVDEHTIRAIGLLSQIENGELAQDHPLAHKIIHNINSRRVLYVAVLLHDICKGRKRDHSTLGAELAMRVCPRLGLGPAETDTVSWLVRHHLLMSHVAFKRDLSDPATVDGFARMVQSPERLRLLVLLTVVDIRAVGPNIWNGWKGQLLRDLYYRTEAVLMGGLSAESSKGRIAAAKQALHEKLRDWTAEDFETHAARFYDNYWTATPIEIQERDARLIRQADRAGDKLTVATRIDKFRSVTEVTIYTQDHAGLFARATGGLAVCGANIVDAKIFTTKDGMALDSFWIQDADGNAFDRPDRLAKLSTAIRQTLAGEMRPREILNKPSVFGQRTNVFTVAPVVLIDNSASTDSTVIEINGRDRSALLFDLTRTLFTLNLTIGSAHIATFGEKAVDVFYVRDLFGHKIEHPGKIKQIQTKLAAVLDKGAPPPKKSGAKPAKVARAAE